MEPELVVTERGGAVWLRINRPEALNAIHDGIIAGLHQAILEWTPRAPVAFVLTGTGRAFCAGADLKAAQAGGVEITDENEAWMDRILALLEAIESSPVPVIAAVNGACAGAGFELLLVCDLAVGVTRAKIGDGHANFGIIPGGGASARLPRLIGMRAAKRLLMLGDLVPAAEAMALGLLNWVVPDDELEAKVDEIVASLTLKAPGGLSRVKYLANSAWRTDLETSLELERHVNREHRRSGELEEGLAAFTEKRPPRFRAGSTV